MSIKILESRKRFKKLTPEAVFLVSLRMSSFPAGNEVYGKSIDILFLAGNELSPSSFPAWLKIRHQDTSVHLSYQYAKLSPFYSFIKPWTPSFILIITSINVNIFFLVFFRLHTKPIVYTWTSSNWHKTAISWFPSLVNWNGNVEISDPEVPWPTNLVLAEIIIW